MQCAKDKVPSQTGVRGDARSLKVANFADHNDVRRLAEDRAQGRGKGHAYLRVHWHLVDAVHLIFNWLFHRDDLAVRLVDVIETGVKRGRLARPSRASDKKNAIRESDQALEDFLIVGKKSKLRQTQLQAGLIQHAHDHALAVVGGNSRDAKIDRLFFDLYLDAAVLRQTLLRDAHGTGHDLEPADNG